MENKLKLFGAEIGFSRTHEPENEYAEDDGTSFNSSSTMSGSSPNGPFEMKTKKKKKYECKWCFKVLPNSQALGGHQNAHKKERMMNKIRLRQIEATRAARLGYYVDQMSAQDSSFDYDCYYYQSNEAVTWQQQQPDHPHISFCNNDENDRFFYGSDVTFLEEDHVHGFSLTHEENNMYSSSTSNQHHHLDLQLGL